ncbi:hypothetical protein GJAV_G00081610 [Gymnothorax javanicus]|nr:hypothetical protein GJAV_G00081610 [Gymnothorax javanicus]
MARRAMKGSENLTCITSPVWYTNSLANRTKEKLFTWSFLTIYTLTCCGFCGADNDFSIMEEAQVLAVQMKKLSSQELGVFTMQFCRILMPPSHTKSFVHFQGCFFYSKNCGSDCLSYPILGSEVL